jgi:hypothetical protein
MSRNQFSLDGSQEIDLTLFNTNLGIDAGSDGFPMESNAVLLVECKNWSKLADSSDVAWFDWKMRLGGVNHGVMLSAKGVTGDVSRRSAAQNIISRAVGEGRFIYVITLDEIALLASAEDLRNLLITKRVGMAAGSPF